jgi:hypothetical protein
MGKKRCGYPKGVFNDIILCMIVTKREPFTKKEIDTVKEQFEIYIKTVFDIKQNICSAGCDLHADSEKLLLQNGSLQENLWGGGVNLETKEIDYNSFINVRPKQGNNSIEIQDPEIRKKMQELTKHFFGDEYE